MKVKVTQKKVKESHKKVLKVGYCNLCHLLKRRPCNYYTTRAEGWASDVYSIGIYAISTGYSPFGDVCPSYELVKRYDDKAKQVLESDPYEAQKEVLNNLIYEFIDEALKEREQGRA